MFESGKQLGVLVKAAFIMHTSKTLQKSVFSAKASSYTQPESLGSTFMLRFFAPKASSSLAATSAPTATKMLTKITAEKVHVSKPTWWLESRFHFSFADYYGGPTNFGALRVLNDDLVQPKAGFGRHGHRDAEIFSYVVDGRLSHADNMGNKESLGRGSVQYLSAGTGITHSEMNDHAERCRFLQVWITPDKGRHIPQYGSAGFDPEDRHNKLLVLLSGTGRIPDWPHLQEGKGIVLHQDTTVVVSENDAGAEHNISLGSHRQAYLVCIEGSMKVNEVHLRQRDAVAIVANGTEELPLTLKAGSEGSHFMLIELAQSS